MKTFKTKTVSTVSIKYNKLKKSKYYFVKKTYEQIFIFYPAILVKRFSLC